METFVQPKVTGYRQLSVQEAEMMNEVKAIGEEIGKLVARLQENAELDQRWVAIGATDIQKGLMALVRSIARPTSF